LKSEKIRSLFRRKRKKIPMPCSTIVKLCVARHGARADDDPSWAQSDPLARLWDPPLSDTGKEQVNQEGGRGEKERERRAYFRSPNRRP